jgi:hypothetical protein
MRNSMRPGAAKEPIHIMSRRKVAPTQQTRRPDRQGSIPKAKKSMSSRKRGEKDALPVENRAAPHAPRRKGQRATSVLDKGKARFGARHSKTSGARRAKHRGVPRSPSLG